MRHKKTKAILEYWMGLYQQANAENQTVGLHLWPDRSDIRPAECSALLADMFILETTRDAMNYRLAGTKLCALFGEELKGQSYLDKFTDVDRHSAEVWTTHLGSDQITVLICGTGYTEDGDQVMLETLLLPLNHAGASGTRVLGLTVPCDPPLWVGQKPIVTQTIRSVRVLKPWEEALPASWPTTRQHVVAPPQAPSFATLEHPASPNIVSFLGATGTTPPPVPAMVGPDPHLSTAEITGGFTAPRMVGHLQVIDGGKKEA